MSRAVLTVAATIFVLAADRGSRTVSHAQETPSVWDGVFTELQATRGQTSYTQQCARCHGDPPVGTDMAPSLVGDDFLTNFNGSTMADLFAKISQTMPEDAPASLRPAQVADLMAFVATSNTWPAGEKELSDDIEALKQIRIVGNNSRDSRTVSPAQEAPSVWDGVFTELQATRGQTLYTEQCVLCHGDPPAGTDMAPSLVGDDFLINFDGSTMADLFAKISQTMPADAPGNLTPAQVADLMAFIAMSNTWPVGANGLSDDIEALKQIRIVRKK